MTTHHSTLAWRIPWTEEPGGLQSTGSQRVRHDGSNLARRHALLKQKVGQLFHVGGCWPQGQFPSVLTTVVHYSLLPSTMLTQVEHTHGHVCTDTHMHRASRPLLTLTLWEEAAREACVRPHPHPGALDSADAWKGHGPRGPHVSGVRGVRAGPRQDLRDRRASPGGGSPGGGRHQGRCSDI